MSNEIFYISSPYKDWLSEVKSKVRSSQIKAALAVNAALIDFYWDLGKMIVEKLLNEKWGNKVIEQLARDLKAEFPDIKGFSRTNLYYVKQFYKCYYGYESIVQQLVGQFPWGHNILIFNQIENIDSRLFYIKQSIENNWSRDTLALQIKTNLHQRQGKSISNFKNTLPKPFSDLARQTLKDPYVFDFLMLSNAAKERDMNIQIPRTVFQIPISNYQIPCSNLFPQLVPLSLERVGERYFYFPISSIKFLTSNFKFPTSNF